MEGFRNIGIMEFWVDGGRMLDCFGDGLIGGVFVVLSLWFVVRGS